MGRATDRQENLPEGSLFLSKASLQFQIVPSCFLCINVTKSTFITLQSQCFGQRWLLFHHCTCTCSFLERNIKLVALSLALCSAVIAHYCKNNGTEQEHNELFNCRGNLLVAAAPCPVSLPGCSSPGLEASPLSSTPLRGAGTDLGWEGWRSRDCKLWHSPDSLFLSPFLYLMFKMVRRKGCQDGPALSLCPKLYPQD